ncbi:nickel/cobalt transporter [Glycomyces rhizosphaerae]|uniref:Nickel/cobalt transporter n=1 Tax=Glycomyces rhizosphaerae TaxID=2054422 RepID=A0ABV7Q1L4_9ACTN
MTGFDSRLLDAFDGAAVDHALWPIAIGVALLVGAAHALRPGHGKTLVAAYLVAERGRWMHAVALAVIVAGLHTVSVLAIGLVWWAFAGERTGSIEPVAVWGRLAAALLVLGVGAVVLRRQWRSFRLRGKVFHRRDHDRVGVGGHGHAHLDGHQHDHVHGAAHHHGPPDGVEPWSWAGLLGIASAGALVPSPAAFLILVSGLLTGRTVLAVVMVACFGIGLAATVLAVGLMVIAGRDWLGRKAKAHRPLARFGAVAPLFGAAAIVGGGLALSASALAALVP